MRATWSFLAMTLRSRARRLLGLLAFGTVFLLAGATARLVSAGEHGHMELDALFGLGGTTLVSALLLLAWLIGRFAIIAVLVLMSGVFSDDRAAGHARLYAVRPCSFVALYAARFAMLCALAFMLAALIMPAFDWIVLGEWIGWTAIVLIAAQIIVFGSLTALCSVATRADAWVALFLGVFALVWDALRRLDFFNTAAPLVRQLISMLLPPQGALVRIETAFASTQPVPWDAFLYVAVYGALVLLIAGTALARRDI
ncbi:MAG: hypothetical protein WEF86_04950 [Gemmatimonadota bacterium]